MNLMNNECSEKWIKICMFVLTFSVGKKCQQKSNYKVPLRSRNTFGRSVEELGDVGVAGCFHKKCYQKILRQKSCTVNIKWHISVFSMGKRISSKNKQIVCSSSTYLPSIDSAGPSEGLKIRGCQK